MNWWNKLCKKMIENNHERSFYHVIDNDHVLDGSCSDKLFEIDNSYFQITLSEMFLKNDREYFIEYIPFTVFLTNFIYNNEKDGIYPFIAGNDTLGEIAKYVGKEYIEIRNTNVVGPVPYMGGDISLFVGLFGTKANDLTKVLFSMVEKSIKAFDVTSLTNYLTLSEPLRNGITGLLGLNEVDFRLGNQNRFSLTGAEGSELRDCYLVYINIPEGNVSKDTFWVDNGRLHAGKDAQSAKPFNDADYCLVKIGRLSRRNDYLALPFNKHWKAAKDFLWNGDNPLHADRAFSALTAEIATSPDLTTGHRGRLTIAYMANFEKEVELYNKKPSGGIAMAGVKTRGGGGKGRKGIRGGTIGGLDAKDVIQQTVNVAIKEGYPEEIMAGLSSLKDNWENIPHLHDRTEGVELTNDNINEQIEMLESVSDIKDEDPKALAELISLITLGQVT